MAILIRLLIIGALAWFGWVLFEEVRELWAIPEDDISHDPTKILLYFLGLIGVGLAAGILIVLTLLPAIGDQVGSFFFNPNQKLEKDPHSKALSAIAVGNYEQATEEYKKIVINSPHDTHAISEIIRIQCDLLHTPQEAADYLSERLEEDRPSDEVAFLANRLVDVYWNHLQDYDRSIAILTQLQENFQETKHAANATHRLRDIQEAWLLAQQQTTSLPPDETLPPENTLPSDSEEGEENLSS